MPPSAIQLTGQPRWVQLTAKTVKSLAWLLFRRTQTAVLAVSPAQGSGDGSWKDTSTVWPAAYFAAGPSEIHSFAVGRISGLNKYPRIGTPTTAPASAPRPMLIRDR